MLAICRAAPAWSEADFKEWIEGEGAQAVAHCTVRRRPNGNVAHYTFSMKDAQDASLVGKQGPWQQYPKRMMQMRARAFALRDTFTPELKGIRMAEEERDITPRPTPHLRQRRAAASNSVPVPPAVLEASCSAPPEDSTTPTSSRGLRGTTGIRGPGSALNCAQVCEQIKQATTMAELNEAADLAQQLPEDDKGVARDAYEVRRSEIRQAQAAQ